MALLETIAVLALAVALSGHERRCMASLHSRDGPVAWGLLGLTQPLVEGAKLFMKSVPMHSHPKWMQPLLSKTYTLCMHTESMA